MPKPLSPTKQKILLFMLAGLGLGLTYSPRRQWKILKDLPKELHAIDEKFLRASIADLYRSKLVERKDNPDGSSTLLLSKKGKLVASTFHFQRMSIARQEWDKKWRVVIFDIPERLRKGRDALRSKLFQLGFLELQKSVFVFPYPCENEIEFVIEFFDLRKFVRFGTMDFIDNDLHLKKLFRFL